MATRYSAFSPEVFADRLERARRAMREARLDALLLVAPEHLYYLAGYDSWVGVNSPQVVILTKGGDEPTLILRNVDLSLALETTVLEDVRTYHLHTDDFAQLVRKVLREKGVGKGRVGIEMQSYALPMAMGRALEEALGAIELVDSTQVIGNLRLIKTPAEIDLVRRAGRFAEKGLSAMRRKLREGMTEIDLAARIEHAMRKAGSDYWSIPTELTSGSRSAGGHGTPRDKIIERGDLVHAEFAGVQDRYHATAMQTIALGKPAKKARQLYDLGIESLAAGIAAIKPGVPVAEVEEASLVPLRREGLEQAAMMRFGYGIGIAYPPIWLEPLQISRGFETRLAANMVFVLHACLEIPEEGLGVIQGGTYLLTDTGLEVLAGAGAVDLVQV